MAPTGERVPLAEVADVAVLNSSSTIAREWSQRRVVVTANVRGRDLGSFVGEARRRVNAEVTLPAGRYRFEWGGQFENYERARLRLLIVVPVAVLLVLVLLYLTYRNCDPSLKEKFAAKYRAKYPGREPPRPTDYDLVTVP